MFYFLFYRKMCQRLKAKSPFASICCGFVVQSARQVLNKLKSRAKPQQVVRHKSNVMRSINPRFTYLLTYLQVHIKSKPYN